MKDSEKVYALPSVVRPYEVGVYPTALPAVRVPSPPTVDGVMLLPLTEYVDPILLV